MVDVGALAIAIAWVFALYAVGMSLAGAYWRKRDFVASGENASLAVWGLTCIATLSGQGKLGLLMGLLAAGFGFFCSLVGQDRQIGVLRFTFGQLYLWNGLEINPVTIGLFAIPEVIDLTVRGTAIAGNVAFGKLGKGVKPNIPSMRLSICAYSSGRGRV